VSDPAILERADALDVLVELLSELDGDSDTASSAFYDRICEALCRTTSMRRAGLMLYDDARKLVVIVGSHGVQPELLQQIYGTLEETPIAQRALSADEVVEISEDLASEVPGRYAQFAGVTTLTCTPVAAGGRWLGVIFADRGGGRFTLTRQERHTMWMLGKMAALAASARIATSQQGQTRQLTERIDLAREIHERVMQRLFGVSLALSSAQELSDEQRLRCAHEIRTALSDLRTAISRPLAPGGPPSAGTLRGELERLGRHYKELPLVVDWDLDESVPEELEPLALAVLAEALRNADKHARPTRVEVRVSRVDGTLTLDVRNDGVLEQSGPRRGAGMGLRLAAFEALQRGGVVEFGQLDDGDWRTRLVVPVP
jgi:signal transduction histidine kinase